MTRPVTPPAMPFCVHVGELLLTSLSQRGHPGPVRGRRIHGRHAGRFGEHNTPPRRSPMREGLRD